MARNVLRRKVHLAASTLRGEKWGGATLGAPSYVCLPPSWPAWLRPPERWKARVRNTDGYNSDRIILLVVVVVVGGWVGGWRGAGL